MKQTYGVTIYGMGGSIFDPKGGEQYLTQRLHAIGVHTGASPYQHYDRQAIYDFLHAAPKDAFIFLIGDSLGAGSAPTFAGDLKREVDYIAGFQPSVYDPLTHGSGEIVVPGNVRYAHCLRDPVWVDTLGLGYATWVAADARHTHLVVTEHRAAHPDDYGYAQDLIFNELHKMIQ